MASGDAIRSIRSAFRHHFDTGQHFAARRARGIVSTSPTTAAESSSPSPPQTALRPPPSPERLTGGTASREVRKAAFNVAEMSAKCFLLSCDMEEWLRHRSLRTENREPRRLRPPAQSPQVSSGSGEQRGHNVFSGGEGAGRERRDARGLQGGLSRRPRPRKSPNHDVITLFNFSATKVRK